MSSMDIVSDTDQAQINSAVCLSTDPYPAREQYCSTVIRERIPVDYYLKMWFCYDGSL
jgi:hypothetical protein